MINYYENPAMSQSKLKDLKRNPRHFWTKHLALDRLPDIETDAMRFGKAVHTCLFEHQLFMSNYIVEPNVDKRTKDGKLAFAEFVANGHLDVEMIFKNMVNGYLRKMITGIGSLVNTSYVVKLCL